MNQLQRTIVISVVTVIATLSIIIIILFIGWWRHADTVSEFVVRHVISNVSNGVLDEDARNDIGQSVFNQSSIVRVVEKASPSVVSVMATKEVPVIERFYRESPFFGFRIPDMRQRGTEERQIGGGSGFFVNADGMVVTNRHVVVDTDASYTVITHDGKKHEARVIARDSVLDIAILDIDSSSYPHLSFADSRDVKVGQSVIAIGNALGKFEGSVSAGIISGLSRNITAGGIFGQTEILEGVIQTDAAINPGNSGGPLLDLNGRVIGVNVAMAQGSENIGFAIPTNDVSAIVDSIKETGEIQRPFLGVRYVKVTEEIQKRFDLPVHTGVLLIGDADYGPAVVPNSPADKAGLQEGDIITAIDGEEITSDRSLAHSIRNKAVNETILVTIIRNGEQITKHITLENASD